MKAKSVSYSMPKLVGMGMSLATPVLMPDNAQSCFTGRVDIKADDMFAESTVREKKWNFVEPENDQGQRTVVITLAEPDKVWTGKDERNFIALARKEALGTITPEELKELEEKGRQRGLLRGKLTIKEIMFRRRQMEAELRLIEAAKEYFHISNPHARKSY